MKTDRIPLLTLLLAFLAGCTTVYQATYQAPNYLSLYGPSAPKKRVLDALQWQQALAQGKISYRRDIKPVLDSRCVACHACYDAPCQLKLNSSAGLDRGATKQVVYDGSRLSAAPPTRLFIDAANTEGWRKKAFHPVLNEREDSKQAALNNSLLAKLLLLKRDNPLPESGKLADSFKLNIDRSLECPTMAEFGKYQRQHSGWGMLYALPGLSLKDEYLLLQWLQEGAKTGPLPALSRQTLKEIALWENFFNGASLKQQLVSRYIHEHLFIGHLHFRGHPEDEFFRLVRSSTPPGQPIQEIATLRPYDDPGSRPFWYRLRPIVATIVDKTHFVYELSGQRMQRYRQLFLQPDYTVTELPSYAPESAANPFRTFQALPRSSRYRFLLDDAQHFVSGFIKGPVCRARSP